VHKFSLLGAAAAILLTTQPAFSVPVTYAIDGEITRYRTNVTNWPTDLEIPDDLRIGSKLTGTITYDSDLVHNLDPSDRSYGSLWPAIKYEFYLGEFGFFSLPYLPPVSYFNVYENGVSLYDEVPLYTEVEHTPLQYLGPEHLWFDSMGDFGSRLAEIPNELPFGDTNLFHVYLRFRPEAYHFSIDAEFRAVEVPEPAPLALFGFGSLLVFAARRRTARNANASGVRAA
jgi:hypothetical protein